MVVHLRPWPLRGRLFGLVIALFVASCATPQPAPLPAAPSPTPFPAPEAHFRAGFGRADITPPPGPGLAGYGPEGRPAAGYRVRLQARALVLEDTRGERLAFVVVDLASIGANLHRLVAERILPETGIGADRLVIAATHTHSGPSHHYGERAYNLMSAGVEGYDPTLVDFLTVRIAEAVTEAYRTRHTARVAWAQAPVWRQTRNRSYEAYRQNQPRPTPPFEPPAGIDPLEAAIDPTWTMLRVEVEKPDRSGFEPAGALSIFAIHGTGNTAAGDLFDADIHGLVAQGLERHIDSRNGLGRRFRARAVHLFANGTEGDVSPNWPVGTRCDPPELKPARRPGGPRTHGGWEWQYPPAQALEACQGAARDYVNEVSDTLAARAARMFDALDGELARDPFPRVFISRAFDTIALANEPDLCHKPRTGTSTVAGAEDGRTRYTGWRLLGLFPIGFEEGGSAIRRGSTGCHREKRILLGPFQGWAVGEHGYPEVAQVSVIRIGTMLLGTVPAEVTTTAGLRMKQAIRNGAHGDEVAMIGLANGFLQYVTTAEEYRLQSYEGGSTLYGPNSAEVIARRLSEVASRLGPVGDPSPDAPSGPLVGYPGEVRQVFQPPTDAPSDSGARRLLDVRCVDSTLAVRWMGAEPGWFAPYRGQVLEIRDPNGDAAAWDDDRYVTVRMLRMQGRGNAIWEATWERAAPGGRYEVVLLERPPFQEIRQPVECRPRR